MDAAVDSVESAGIACTMTLEQALFDAANGMCRNLLDALLASEAAEEFSKTHGFFMGKDAVMSLARRQSQRVSSFLNSRTPSGGKPEPGEVVCVEGDGTGIRYRRKHMRGVKGRNGRAKTRPQVGFHDIYGDDGEMGILRTAAAQGVRPSFPGKTLQNAVSHGWRQMA